ncbi:very-long-chain (3R)-3-hydroxyacyl-CoA dehydratase PASTICCINO 2-like isoform X1 [Rutidosis leptorrhynchoides]|uniref:very-long-chain (3R)-3-hydroxyacyl-CoA dehydratase PASTICCINO 2-like isoform X1 n=1 Tax=Rutidosis leptorrhynchoides TaxID=125765 RepID=UPI003A99C215
MAGAVRRMYLITYNWLVCAGWFQVLYIALKTLIESGHNHVYEAIEKPLLLAQSAAFFEILHSVIGLVRSPISAALPQISSRLYVVWGILYSFQEVQTHPLVSAMIISWCITEIIRYSFFGMKETFGSAPFWLLWLRYSTFLILYPLGIGSEVYLIYKALPYIKESGFCSARMPNKWNFSFDYFYCAILVLGVYIPGAPHLYGYMLGQRKKTLYKSRRE